jgi:2-oxoglutarate/2-oxoacid ferredoxin oxidoreductase subunit beta
MREGSVTDLFSVVLGGPAGSGIQTIEEILTRAFRRDGYHVFSASEFMSRIRGGSNSTLIRIGSRPVRAWSDTVDLFIPLDDQALAHVRSRLGDKTLVLADHAVIGPGTPGYDLPLAALAKQTGHAIHGNTIAAGAIWGICARDLGHLDAGIRQQFAGKAADVIEQNQAAARQGYDVGTRLREKVGERLRFPPRPAKPGPLFLKGAEAVGFGALAGGCNFVSSYPMSPSTGVLTWLAQRAREFGLALEPGRVVIVSGIGQAAKLPHYLTSHFFNGLHGRALPVATAIRAANPTLTVTAESGDGDMYGEGGNHFLHAVRRNPDVTQIVHDNMVYGLTKGQASPTSQKGFQTPVQFHGVTSEPLNPVALAIALNASFVARAFAGDGEGTRDIMMEAVRHKGFALVDILQPCVTFNRVNTYGWFKNNTRRLPGSHDCQDREAAFRLALETAPIPLGILFRETGRPTFEENLGIYQTDPRPLFERRLDIDRLRALLEQACTTA